MRLKLSDARWLVAGIAIITACTFSISCQRVQQGQAAGKAAPPLHIAKWIKGDPVNLADGMGKNIYVVEFWATWCPPCRTTIPHLGKLQQEYEDKNVIIIGVSMEDEKTVQAFVKNQKRMTYRVALDDQGQTAALWMKSVRTIPHAFLVDKQGKIVWHGHPQGGLDAEIAKLVAQK